MKRYLTLLLAALVVAACGEEKLEPEQPDTPAVPSKPTKLNLHKKTETSLTFQWDAVNGATSYTWEIQQGGTKVQEGSEKTRNVEVKNLTKATDYRFGVKATNSAGSSAAEWIDVRTDGTEDPVPGPVSIAYEDFAIPSVEEDGIARAFPGAEGGGMYATGGRGGKVIHVTNLNDSGKGSLREALNTDGARIIVFDVAGTIALQSDLRISKGNVTIAGQTAPGDGICLKNYTFRIHASNVIVRFIRCRMGDEAATENDAMQVMDKGMDTFEKIIIDHCSVSWSTDECASFYGMKDFTFQWNIVSESLRNSVHVKGSHGYGGIWGGTNATYHHNLLAHHDSRNPRIDHDYVSPQKGPVSIFNNVVYNWKGNTCYGGESSDKNGSDYRKYNFFNNYYKPGPVTPSNHIWFLQPTTSCSNCGGTILPGHFYMDGNVMHGKSDLTADNWKAGRSSPVSVYISEADAAKIKEAVPYHSETYQSVHTAERCMDPVLTYSGASFARDNIDTRIARETKEGTYTYEGSNVDPKDEKGNSLERSYKGLIDSQKDVADATWKDNWPVYAASDEQKAKVKDTDGDGIPDAIEDAWGMDKNSAADGSAKTLDKNGRYTNLEMYLHYLVKDIVSAQNAGGEYKKL